MDIMVLDLVKEGGSLVLLAAVLLLVGVPLVRSTNRLSHSVESLLEDMRRDRARVNSDLAKIKMSLKVAFGSSNIIGYRLAAEVLDEDEEEVNNSA
jgi:hypothetical protein